MVTKGTTTITYAGLKSIVKRNLDYATSRLDENAAREFLQTSLSEVLEICRKNGWDEREFTAEVDAALSPTL
jgi:hypothetical protein